MLFPSFVFYTDDAEVARVEHSSQSDTGGIDLNCGEHVSDTETDSQSDEEALIENKRFPQQRFSPVQKHVTGADITHRPKPIKMKPELPFRAELTRHVAIDQSEMPRPASTGSGFQPKGAVFKAHSPKVKLDTSRVDDTRPSSVKSDTGIQVSRGIHNGLADLNGLIAQQQTMQRSQSISNINHAKQQKQPRIQSMATRTTTQNQVCHMSHLQ